MAFLTGPEWTQMMVARDRLIVVLRDSLAAHGKSTEQMQPTWEALTDEANTLAHRYGVSTITLDQVRRLESLALGHIDYAQKYPLYIAQRMWGVI